ncbi:MAG: hypothetical protein VCC00_06775 [Deltaproteobacteria bacterium]
MGTNRSLDDYADLDTNELPDSLNPAADNQAVCENGGGSWNGSSCEQSDCGNAVLDADGVGAGERARLPPVFAIRLKIAH